MNNQMGFLKDELAKSKDEIEHRDNVEAKVNAYVQELVDKNKELTS